MEISWNILQIILKHYPKKVDLFKLFEKFC